MIKKQIVKRRYTLFNGTKCDQIFYIAQPTSALGGEIMSGNIQDAFLFDSGECAKYNYGNWIAAGQTRQGNYKYYQKVLDVHFLLKKSLHDLLNDFGNSSLRRGVALQNSNQVAEEVNLYISEKYPNLE